MKNSIVVSMLGVLAVAALVTFSESNAEDGKDSSRKQKLVKLEGFSSYVMRGDSEFDSLPNGKVLPRLLSTGWRIVQIESASQGNGSSANAYLLLEK